MKKSNSNEDDCDKTYNSISFGNISSEFHCFLLYPLFYGFALNSYRLLPNTAGLQAVEGLRIMYSHENGFSNADKTLIDNGYV